LSWIKFDVYNLLLLQGRIHQQILGSNKPEEDIDGEQMLSEIEHKVTKSVDLYG
jgi:hypothetical protein